MEITDIKQHLSIARVLNHYNLQPDRNNLLTCPFHEDKTPSLQIYPKTNTFHCFSCGKTGDTIDFVMHNEKCNKHQALLKCANLIDNGKLTIDNEKNSIQNPVNFETLYQSFKQSIPPARLNISIINRKIKLRAAKRNFKLRFSFFDRFYLSFATKKFFEIQYTAHHRLQRCVCV